MDEKPFASNLLLERLERFIKSEGLLRLVPTHRHEQAFDAGLPLVIVMMLFFVGQQIMILRSYVSLSAAILISIGAIVLGVVGAISLSAIEFFRKRGKVDSVQSGVRALLTIMIAAILGPAIYLQSLWALLLGALWTVGGVLLMMFFYAFRFRIFAVLSQIRLAGRIATRAIRLAGVVMPLLILLVFFSVFTEELWSAFYTVDVVLLPVLFLLLYIPALLFAKYSVAGEIVSALEEVPTMSSAELRSISTINKAVEKGLVSREELLDADAQFSWRDHERSWQTILPAIRAKLNNVLGTLSITLTIILVVAFAVYLWLILTILVPNTLVGEWLAIDVGDGIVEAPIIIKAMELDAIDLARAKVAAVLAMILAIVAHVAGPADANVRAALFAWLRPTVEQWKTAALFYHSLTSKNIQIIDYKVLDKRRGIANMIAFVSPTATAKDVEQACQLILEQRKSYKLVIVRAFPRHPDFSTEIPTWRFDSWEMIANRHTDHYSFEHRPASPPELHQQHYLGIQSHSIGGKIPESWFGDSPKAVSLGQTLWSLHRDVLLHPYVRSNEKGATLELRLMKRLPQSEAYQELIAHVMESFADQFPELDVYLYHRGEVNNIAHLDWSVGYMSYKDELGKKMIRKAESVSAVINTLRSPF